MSPHSPGTGNRTGSRRDFLRGAAALSAAIAGAPLVTACAPGTGAAEGFQGRIADHYPADYDRIIETSRAENGLTIYSNTSQENWAPLFAGFQERYPWADNLAVTALGSTEVFQRFYSEDAGHGSAADLLVANAPQEWARFAHRDAALAYDTPERPFFDDKLEGLPGVFALTVDPVVIGYNALLLEDVPPPRSLADIARLCESDPGRFRDNITTYALSNAYGFAINHTYVATAADPWATLDRLIPFVRAETSAGAMVDKLVSGEYAISYFQSGGVIALTAEQSKGLIDWSYIEDGTPLVPRSAAILRDAPNANTAKLFIDHALSYAGQVQLSEGGLTPHRGDLRDDDAPGHYDAIVEAVGADNAILVGYEELDDTDVDALTQRWEQARSA
ncbi:ABC transporter substrate-binding protein [Nocardiopsis mangrovi]|uniref:ABC transporter substrate-binding protein n=1 Tax=Nocardiopsis mangrovi TaxID=1179818 RepID=A0ABV9E6C5_9ACTN